jgi:hypothetical protein
MFLSVDKNVLNKNGSTLSTAMHVKNFRIGNYKDCSY